MTQLPSARFGSARIALHWLVVLMMGAIYVGMECRGWFPKEYRATTVRILHYSFGITVLLLVPLRLALGAREGIPPISPPPPRWQEQAARLMHLALYLFMIGMPLLAWLSYSLRSKPVWFYGFDLPGLVPEADAILRKQLKLMTWHKRIAEAGYWLIGLHAAAALVHHHLMRDDTLTRMLPKRR